MSALAQALAEYLAIRRALGFKLTEYGALLGDLIADLERAGASTMTTDAALAWATKSVGVQPFRWKARLSVARGFAHYLHALDPVHEVPPADLLAYRRSRTTPRVYSPGQIAALLATTDTLRPPLRAASYRALFGLLAASGLRVGEAIRLDRDDVDLHHGFLLVKDTKFGKSRELPLHPSTVAALDRYAGDRDRLTRRPAEPAFFVSGLGTRLVYSCARAVFVRLAADAGLAPRAGKRAAHMHDLRHRFAVATLLDWYRAGVDIAPRLPLLAAYLGHSHPSASYWYLEAVPELLALAAQRLEHALGDLS